MNEDEPIIRLEERFTHLQDHVAAQDRVILELGDSLDRLRRELAILREQVRKESAAEDAAIDERPPHY